MSEDELDRAGVEKYLDLATRNVIEEHKTSGPADICARLVEKINSELPDKCQSVENYKYIVHATVQEQYGQGSLVGGKCVWDRERDAVVSLNMTTEKVSVSLQVFFIYIED